MCLVPSRAGQPHRVTLCWFWRPHHRQICEMETDGRVPPRAKGLTDGSSVGTEEKHPPGRVCRLRDPVSTSSFKMPLCIPGERLNSGAGSPKTP